MTRFYFNTGVRHSVSSYCKPGDRWVPAIGGDKIRQIPFDCNDVPDNAKLMFLCDCPELPESAYSNVVVRTVVGGNMVSKYAYFRIHQPVTVPSH